jgi:mannose-6-phosphate isomerase-like protein (cupin superfamily)
MKRVIVATNGEGRSYVESTKELAEGESITVWEGRIDIDEALAAIDPASAVDWLEPPLGGVKWRFAHIKPHGEHTHPPGLDKDGMHVTRTVDFQVIVDGEINLVLDEGTVELQAGDFIILKAARHAWRNLGQNTVILMALLTRPATASS